MATQVAIKYSCNRNEAAVKAIKVERLLSAACGSWPGSMIISATRGLMATTTWTTTMGGSSE